MIAYLALVLLHLFHLARGSWSLRTPDIPFFVEHSTNPDTIAGRLIRED